MTAASAGSRGAQAFQWWLATRNKDDWAKNDKLEIRGAGGGPVQTVDVTKMSDDELKDLQKRIADGSYAPPETV